jgi:hypothetical protein
LLPKLLRLKHPDGLPFKKLLNIFQYISNTMQIYTISEYLETALHVSGVTSTHHQGAHATVFTASGICHTVTATCRYRGGVGTPFQLLHEI